MLNFCFKISLILFALLIKNNIVTCVRQQCEKAYSTCSMGKAGMINVHLVPHTHDDVGWLKTVDQYFYGSNAVQQEATVQYILDTVIPELEKDPTKRFVYVEMAYMWRWWKQQKESQKQLVRTLVDDGRLEFVIGGWCMNDEATTYYTDIIDQQTLGLKFILKEFGPCARPRSAWQIDPFGHSREQASLFAQFGFDGLFLGRVDYQDYESRGKAKTREMLWQASRNLDANKAQLFTGILNYGYNPPPGFCFDSYCIDDPIMDDVTLEDYNVDAKVSAFINYTFAQASSYKTNHLIMTMGSDFQYSNAHRWYKNLDKLIHYVNKMQANGSNVNVFYSTPACYLYALNQAETKWSVKYDDFFPYAHRPHAFWTGYFTSRPAFKLYVRRASNFLQSIRHLAIFANLNDEQTVESMSELERALGVAQHHDAVSGTERQHVAYDYAKRLAQGINDSIFIINEAFRKLLFKSTDALATTSSRLNESMPIIYCPLLNISQCNQIENLDHFTVLVYNPLPRKIQTYLKIPIVLQSSGKQYAVQDQDTGLYVLSESSSILNETISIPERSSQANYNLVFQANLPPMGMQVYSISKETDENIRKISFALKKRLRPILVRYDNVIVMKNKYLQVKFNSNGNLIQLVNLESQLSTELTQNFCFYKSKVGNNSIPEFQASGAYVFRPDGNDLEQYLTCLSVTKFNVYQGEQFVSIHQTYNEWISQTVRLYADTSNVEFEWQVGPIPIDDKIGKEVIIRFNSDLDSSSTFYTDSNGREILKRFRNFRPTWNLNMTEPIAGNYYPINSRIFIRDEKTTPANPRQKEVYPRQLTLVTDRSQGGSSIQDGSIEIMLHRRILNDDALGVSEPLNETGSDGKGLIVNGILNLLFDSTNNSARLHRELSHRINNQPLISFISANVTTSLKKLGSKWRGLRYSLPDNVHLLTFMKDYDDVNNDLKNTVIIRLEHFYEADEDHFLSQPVTINIKDALNQTLDLLALEELLLGANDNVKSLDERLKWQVDDAFLEHLNERNSKKPKESKHQAFDASSFVVTLSPMQIRTFRLWFSPKNF